jgi:cytoskeletal protein CcmA (bactofilin family)
LGVHSVNRVRARHDVDALAAAASRNVAVSRPKTVWLGVCLCLPPMRWNRRNPIVSDSSMAFINEGSELTGTCSFKGSVVFSGRAKGDIEATATLTVGRPGRLEARLRAPIVIIEGEVVGSVIASERIEIREHARVYGDLQTAVLVIAEGAIFEGQTHPPVAPATDESRRDLTTTFATAQS